MTSKDLRTLMSTELDTLTPMPDLVPQVIRQGATQVRRRRLAVSGLVAAAAIGGVAIAPWANGRSQGSDSQPADGGGSSAVPSDVPSPSPLGDSLVLSDPEVMAAFDAALPDRFTPVTLRPRTAEEPWESLVTRTGDTDVVLTARMWAAVETETGDCLSFEEVASCKERDLPSGGHVAAAHSGETSGRNAWVVLTRDGVETTIDLWSKQRSTVVPLTDAELLDVATHPAFLAMIDAREPTANPTDVPSPNPTSTVAPPEPTDAPPAPTASPTPSDQPTDPAPVPTFPTEATEATEPTDAPPTPTSQPTRPPTSDSATPTAAPTPSAVPTDK